MTPQRSQAGRQIAARRALYVQALCDARLHDGDENENIATLLDRID